MRNVALVLIVLVAVSLGGAVDRFLLNDHAPVGRYEMYVRGGGEVYVLDTTSGQVTSMNAVKDKAIFATFDAVHGKMRAEDLEIEIVTDTKE